MLPTATLIAAVACLPAPDDHPHGWLRRVTVVTAPEVFAERLRAVGFAWHAEGKSAEALVAFEAALRLTPSEATLSWGRALALAALGRHDEAADEYARLLTFAPTDGDLWRYVAYGWVERGRYEEAEACFAEARRWCVSDAERFEAYLREAVLWCGATPTVTPGRSLRGATGRADTTLARAFDLPPERLLRAEHALTHAVSFDTDGEYNTRADAHRCRAGVRFALGRTVEAILDIDHALSLRPADGGGHYLRACLAERQRDADTGLRHLELAAWYGVRQAEIAEKRCDVLTAASRHAEAEVFAREWCRLSPDAYHAFRQHGELLRVLGKDDESDRAAERAAGIAGRPMVLELLLQAKVLADQFDNVEAVRRITDRLLDRPGMTRKEYLTVLYSRIGFLFSIGQTSEAFENATRAVRLAPEDVDFRELRLKMSVHLYREREAIEDAGALLRLRPHDPEAWKWVQKVRGPEELRAAMAGREPDYRPAGPLVPVPISVSVSRACVTELGERQRGGVR